MLNTHAMLPEWYIQAKEAGADSERLADMVRQFLGHADGWVKGLAGKVNVALTEPDEVWVQSMLLVYEEAYAQLKQAGHITQAGM